MKQLLFLFYPGCKFYMYVCNLANATLENDLKNLGTAGSKFGSHVCEGTLQRHTRKHADLNNNTRTKDM